jgi:hypothetical protein
MTEKKLKKLLQEYPYLIDDTFIRSRTEAMRLISGNDVSIEDFIERAKRRSALPASSWDVFTEALARKQARELQKKEAIKPNIFSSISITPRFLRRAVVVLITLALLTGFFTLTEPGVALAQAAYKIIVRLLDGKLTAQQDQYPDNLPPIDFENIPEQFESHEQAAKVIGRPVASIESEDAVLVSIDVQSVEGSVVTLWTQYQVKEYTVFLKQLFYVNMLSWSSGVSTDHIECEKELQDGNIMYIGYMNDGTVFGNTYSESYNISVTSKGMDANKLLDIISEMQFLD